MAVTNLDSFFLGGGSGLVLSGREETGKVICKSVDVPILYCKSLCAQLTKFSFRVTHKNLPLNYCSVVKSIIKKYLKIPILIRSFNR